MRIQISLSKGKTRKVRRLATHNQELQEILGYSERIIPIADERKSSNPVKLFEDIRQHACAVHNVLKRHWKCSGRNCQAHQAHLNLQAETKIVSLNVLFILEGKQGPLLRRTKQDVMILPANGDAARGLATTQISYVEQASSFTAVQESFEDAKNRKKASSFSKMFSKGPKNASPAPSSVSVDPSRAFTSRKAKQVHFQTSMPTNALVQETSLRSPPAATTGINHLSSQSIVDLCSSLRNCRDTSFGVIIDEFDRIFQLSKPLEPSSATIAPDSARLVPLPNLLDAYHQASMEITRQHRFGMAVHIASALLQVQMTPWLSDRWSKHELYFLADTNAVYSDRPYVSQAFVSDLTGPPEPVTNNQLVTSPSISEEDTRSSLFTVGVIILELIFGHNIESCSFRHLYYGSNNQPNDQTDVSTARKWAQKVLGECGVEIADVVRRCLDCSFGPRPSFKDKRFREAVYEGVIRPLAEYSKTWQVTMK